jgi:hypothetical protein
MKKVIIISQIALIIALCPLFEGFFIFSGPVGIWIKIHLNPNPEFQDYFEVSGVQ